MRVDLADATDLAGFRAAARRFLTAGVAPSEVRWVVDAGAAPGLFDAADAGDPAPARGAGSDTAESAAAGSPRLPASFVALCEEVVLHRDPDRFDLLYRLAWRLHRTPALRGDILDPEFVRARRLAQAVRRDSHKMKAFVRFREVARGAGVPPLHVAWFEPLHHVVAAVAPFFARRFANLAWAILTPDRCVHWDGAGLRFGAGAGRADAPAADAGEALWLTYYESIFNPARLKLRMMTQEMPRHYWPNLPEAALISGLAAAAPARSAAMIARAPTVARTAARRWPVVAMADDRTPNRQAPGAAAPAPDLAALRHAAQPCRECPLGALATQTVWGEGAPRAALMLVGEQPGDLEDLHGRPFVGPAGQLLDRALADLGWARAAVYLTNAVKHFKYEPRGKRRIHKTPAQREADACLHWLESEIALVRPQAVVALGATAARQLLGRPVAVLRERGSWVDRADGRRVLVTLHPSALLRADPADHAAAYAAWLADLRQAAAYAAPGAGAAR